MNAEQNICYVSEIGEEFQFISDSQDVKAIKDNIKEAADYDSFFVTIQDGDYTAVLGIQGIIPYLDKIAHRIL